MDLKEARKIVSEVSEPLGMAISRLSQKPTNLSGWDDLGAQMARSSREVYGTHPKTGQRGPLEYSKGWGAFAISIRGVPNIEANVIDLQNPSEAEALARSLVVGR